MKKYIKTLLILSFLLTTTLSFAFPGDIGTGSSGQNDPPAPIDTYLIVMVVLGIGIALWANAKKTEKA